MTNVSLLIRLAIKVFLTYSFCLQSTPLARSVCSRRLMHSWGSLNEVIVILFEWVELVSLRGVCDLAGVADAISRFSNDFFELESALIKVLIFATGVCGWLLISRSGLLIPPGVCFCGVEFFFGVACSLFSLFGLVVVRILGETIRRAAFSESRTGGFFATAGDLILARGGTRGVTGVTGFTGTPRGLHGGVKYWILGVAGAFLFTGVLLLSQSSCSFRFIAAIRGELRPGKLKKKIRIDSLGA